MAVLVLVLLSHVLRNSVSEQVTQQVTLPLTYRHPHTDSPIDTHACTYMGTHIQHANTHPLKDTQIYTYMNSPHTEAHSLNNHMRTHADKHTRIHTEICTYTQIQMHTNAHRHALYMRVPTMQTHTCRHTETCPRKDIWWE